MSHDSCAISIPFVVIILELMSYLGKKGDRGSRCSRNFLSNSFKTQLREMEFQSSEFGRAHRAQAPQGDMGFRASRAARRTRTLTSIAS